MLHENHRLHYMYTRLYRAWQEEEFRLHFQTLVDAKKRRLAGFEALVRWYNKADDEIVQPGGFLPFAEDTGLIVLIGEWILKEACRQARLWNRLSSSTITIAINLAPVQLLDDSLVEQVEAAIKGLPPDALKLEIPETCLVEHAKASYRPLVALKQLGVQIAIDEFGAGYSSIPSLIKFPYDEIKFSRRFIAKLESLPEARVLAEGMIDIAHKLNKRVVAVGVETEEQTNLLRDMGCDLLQGYLFGEPGLAGQMSLKAGVEKKMNHKEHQGHKEKNKNLFLPLIGGDQERVT